ncbi:hypothetical protein Pla108_12620 [Botrimarina colliarenosi]|uniref:Uncharacterized protein n=1 Tax=Botrimarina colliarenosi TaxID=2528001 RepID=A0A5C6AJV8_9BACT|nr:hypothetical protein [Botrimarina colliarenosi]TWU00313.1 hypothetical protein Pla108_12620 [Botrimarina colliarenosi]
MAEFMEACFELCLYILTDEKPSRAMRITRAVIIWLVLFLILSALVVFGLNYFFG